MIFIEKKGKEYQKIYLQIYKRAHSGDKIKKGKGGKEKDERFFTPRGPSWSLNANEAHGKGKG